MPGNATGHREIKHVWHAPRRIEAEILATLRRPAIILCRLDPRSRRSPVVMASLLVDHAVALRLLAASADEPRGATSGELPQIPRHVLGWD